MRPNKLLLVNVLSLLFITSSHVKAAPIHDGARDGDLNRIEIRPPNHYFAIIKSKQPGNH